jgi:hypothetical protein
MADYSFEETNFTYFDTPVARVKSLDPKWKDSPAFMLTDSFRRNSKMNKNFEVYSDDIWLTCYPKTGSTLVQEMVWLVNNDLDFEAAKSPIEEKRFPYYE